MPKYRTADWYANDWNTSTATSSVNYLYPSLADRVLDLEKMAKIHEAEILILKQRLEALEKAEKERQSPQMYELRHRERRHV